MERTSVKGLTTRQSVNFWMAAASAVLWAAISFSSSFLKLGSVISPFPAAVIALLPLRYSLAAAGGALAGALVTMAGGGSAVMLLSSLLVFAVRLICEQYRRLLPLLLPAAALTAVCLTGDGEAAGWLVALSGAYYALLCLGAYLFLRPLGESQTPAAVLTDPRQRLAAMTLLFAACAAGSSVTVGGLAIFSTVGMLLLICLTREAPPLYAGICGAVCGLLLGAARGQPVLSAALMLGCLTMAYIKKEGNFKLAGFLGAAAAVIFSFSTGLSSLICFYEAALAALLAACIPASIFGKLQAAARPETAVRERGDRDKAVYALCETITGLKKDFEAACRKLDAIKSHREPPDKVAESVCGGCRYKNHCYNGEYDRTVSWLSGLVSEACGGLPPSEPPFHACPSADKLYTLFTGYYSDAAHRPSGKLQARKIVAEQLGLMADLLLVSVQLGESEKTDGQLESKLSQAAGRMKIALFSADAQTGDNGRTEVCLTTRAPIGTVEKQQLRNLIADHCATKIAEPSQKIVSGTYRTVFRSVARISLQFASAQLPAESGGCCGDCFTHYEAGAGQELFVLCDGMGTGGDAAVDGTMAAAFFGQLCARGATPDVAVRTASTVLSVRADTESLSTLDAVLIDVYRARARIFKAGAFTTLLLRNGTVLRFDGGALPIGIIDRPDYSEREIKLSRGDVLVMASDGVADEDWLALKLQNRGNMSPGGFCAAVADEAHSRQSKPDDITVAMIVVE